MLLHADVNDAWWATCSCVVGENVIDLLTSSATKSFEFSHFHDFAKVAAPQKDPHVLHFKKHNTTLFERIRIVV